jgi:TP901 family phage tail tape measure protein
MNKVAAVTQATGEEFKALREQAKELGATTQFSATQASEAMTFLAMAGLNVQDVMKAMPGTLQLAAAGGLDLAAAADIATNVLTAMGMKVEELSRVNDVLALAQAKSNTNVSQLAEAFRPVASTASMLGFEIEEVTALLGKLADVGEKGSAAGTQLRFALLQIVNPTNKARNAFSELGINIEEFTTEDGKIKDFTKLIGILGERGATATQLYKMFGQRGARAIAALLKSGKPAIEELTEKLKNAEGTAAKMAKTMQKGLPGAVNAVKSAFEAVQIAIAESGIGEAFTDFLNFIARLLRGIAKLNPIILKMVSIFAGLVAVAGPLLVVISLAIKGFFAMKAALLVLSPAFLSMAGSILLIIGLLKVLSLLLTTTEKEWEEIGLEFDVFVHNLLIDIEKSVNKFFAGIERGISRKWKSMTNFLESVWKRFIDNIKSFLEPLISFVGLVMDKISAGVKTAIEKIGKQDGR